MYKIHSLILDITRARAVQLRKGRVLRENDILYSFSPKTLMARPWKRLPNVKEMAIRTNSADMLLLSHGFLKKLSPELKSSPLSWRIRACNRYLTIIEYRLERLLRNKDAYGFWILALKLMACSKVLRMISLRKLDINWFQRWSMSKVVKMLRALDSRIQNLDVTAFIVRHYVPKGEAGWRPIGSPSYPDRMFLYMWQCFFVMFLGSYIDSSQHAYVPGRGTTTALADVALHLQDPKWKYIWEFDLKGAFPSVNTVNTSLELVKRGLPPHIGSLIKYMALSTIERVDLAMMERKLVESKFDIQAVLTNLKLSSRRGDPSSAGYLLNSLIGTATTSSENVGKRLAKLMSDPLLASEGILVPRGPQLIEGRGWVAPDFEAAVTLDDLAVGLREAPVEIIDDILGAIPLHQVGRGFPQGSGLSPILFDFAFETMIRRVHIENKKYLTGGEIKVISYADDFIVLSTHGMPWDMLTDMPFQPDPLEAKRWDGMHNEIALLNAFETRDLGLRFNESKSRITKEDGLWQHKQIKFIGATFWVFDSVDEIAITGTPRSGKTLAFGEEQRIMVERHALREESLLLAKLQLRYDAFARNSTTTILNEWGFGTYPFKFLPLSLIRDGKPLDADQVKLINSQIAQAKYDEEVPLIARTNLNAEVKISPVDFLVDEQGNAVRATKKISFVAETASIWPAEELSPLIPDQEVELGSAKILLPKGQRGLSENFVRNLIDDESDDPHGVNEFGKSFIKSKKDKPSLDLGSRTPGWKDGGVSYEELSTKFTEFVRDISEVVTDVKDDLKEIIPTSVAGSLDFLKSPLAGTIVSKLYNGSWLPLQEFEKREPFSNKGSWLSKRQNAIWESPLPAPEFFTSWEDSNYSNSSFAGLDLIKILRARGQKAYSEIGFKGKTIIYRPIMCSVNITKFRGPPKACV